MINFSGHFFFTQSDYGYTRSAMKEGWSKRSGGLAYRKEVSVNDCDDEAFVDLLKKRGLATNSVSYAPKLTPLLEAFPDQFQRSS